MRTALVVALLSLSVPGIAHAQHSDSSSHESVAAVSESLETGDSLQSGDGATDSDVIFSGTPEYGLYLSPTTQLSRFQGRSRAFVGGRGGLVVSDVLRVGGGANWLVGGPKVDVGQQPTLRMRYGGGLIGFNIGAESVVHPSIDVLIGGGKAQYESGGLAMNGRSESFFVVEGATGLDFNLSYGVRLHVGGGYRYLSSLDLPGLSADELGGPFGMVQLKFGAF